MGVSFEWKPLSIEQIVDMPLVQLKERGINATGAFFAFESAQHGREFHFRIGTAGRNISLFEIGGETPDWQGMLHAVDGEVQVYFSDLFASEREFPKSGIYFRKGRAYLEHFRNPSGDGEKIARAHFYRVSNYGEMTPLPLSALLPFTKDEQWLIDHAAEVGVKERYFKGKNGANPSYWSELRLQPGRFSYSLLPASGVALDIASSSRPKDVLEAARDCIPVELVYVTELRPA